MLVLDPGFFSTASCRSEITYIDGDEGVLLYRGYPIEQLAERSNYLETCYLLLYGELPAEKKMLEFSGSFRRDSTANCAANFKVCGAICTLRKSDSAIIFL